MIYLRAVKTSRAAVLTNYEAPLELKEFPLPESIEPGAALVKVTLAGICGTDVHLWRGQLPIPLPVILGHETVGVIEALGEGLTVDWSGQPLAVGDRINCMFLAVFSCVTTSTVAGNSTLPLT